MYREHVARSRAVPLVARAASARWCRARPVSETVFSVSRRDVCSSYCLRRVTTARFPNCDCWKAKPVEIGQGTACERDDTRFFGSASNFSRLFCREHVCAWKLACYEQWNGVSELWKTLLGRFHKLKDFLACDGVPNWFHWILHAHRRRSWLPVYGIGYAMILQFFFFILATLFILRKFVYDVNWIFSTITDLKNNQTLFAVHVRNLSLWLRS